MKAIQCANYGQPESLLYTDLPDLEPGPNEVIVQIRACAVNFPDTLIIQGKYQLKPELPFTPGSDFSGVVKSVGINTSKFQIGDEVFGIVPFGGFAEELKVKEDRILPKPANIDFQTAASYYYAYGTSLHALKDRGKLKSQETLVVLGAAGGVGLAAVEIGKLIGARVIACASTKEKLELCKQYGADELINYTKEDLKQKIKELTGGRGADVVLDPVGGSFAESAIRATAWKGRYLVVGFAAGSIPKIALNLALLKGCSLVGVFWGRSLKEDPSTSYENSQQILKWIVEKKINPHIHKVYSLKDTALAIQEMMDRKVKGKVVVNIPS